MGNIWCVIFITSGCGWHMYPPPLPRTISCGPYVTAVHLRDAFFKSAIPSQSFFYPLCVFCFAILILAYKMISYTYVLANGQFIVGCIIPRIYQRPVVPYFIMLIIIVKFFFSSSCLCLPTFSPPYNPRNLKQHFSIKNFFRSWSKPTYAVSSSHSNLTVEIRCPLFTTKEKYLRSKSSCSFHIVKKHNGEGLVGVGNNNPVFSGCGNFEMYVPSMIFCAVGGILSCVI